MGGIGESLPVRLQRLAAAAERSRQTAEDDTRAFHDACDEARQAGHSYGWIAAAIGKSRTQTFRIANALTGPRARGDRATPEGGSPGALLGAPAAPRE